MDKDLTVDKDYVRFFNEGYTLAKELGLKPNDLQGIHSGQQRIKAMYQGMEQFEKDQARDLEKAPDRRKIFDRIDAREKNAEKTKSQKPNKDKGLDMEP